MKRLCYQYMCEYYPKCKTAAGSFCAIDEQDNNSKISSSECFDLEEHPLFVPKPEPWKPKT